MRTDPPFTRALDVIDHLLLGVPDLDEGIVFVERLTGVRAVVGGSHPGRGTHNALIALSAGRYIEIIAPDPHQDVISRLSTLVAPALVGWAALTNDIDTLAERLRAADVETSGPLPGSRSRPDGRVLTWKTLSLSRTFAHAEIDPVPFFIQWDTTSVHPSADSPAAGELLTLELHHPNAGSLRRAFESIGIDADVCEAGTTRLVAAIRTSSGVVTL